MATQLFIGGTARPETSLGGTLGLSGTERGHETFALRTTRDIGSALFSANTVAGPTNGVELIRSGGSLVAEWLSEPLDAAATISGSITWNIWASESNMSANVAINARLEVVDGATGAITLIDQTARVTELGTSDAAVNFSETPASGVACKRGDRLRLCIFGSDVGTMASGYTFRTRLGGTTSGDVGDSYVTLTENLTFMSTSVPTGSTIYLTNTASPVSTASIDREAWTSSAPNPTSVTNTAAGWTSGIIQCTDAAGGTAVDWFTKTLAAFTLAGLVECEIRHNWSSSAASAVSGVEIAIVDGDGTGASAWAKGVHIFTNAGISSFQISGEDRSVVAGQRLRIRVFLDDWEGGPMAAGHTATFTGTSSVIFSQTLTEGSAGPATPAPHARRQLQQLLAH